MKKLNQNDKQEQLSTVNEFLQKLTPKERKEFDNDYKKLLTSELLFAMIAKDHKHVEKLAQALKLSPVLMQQIQIKPNQDYGFQTIVKILKKVGYKNIKLEYAGEDINIPLSTKKN